MEIQFSPAMHNYWSVLTKLLFSLLNMTYKFNESFSWSRHSLIRPISEMELSHNTRLTILTLQRYPCKTWCRNVQLAQCMHIVQKVTTFKITWKQWILTTLSFNTSYKIHTVCIQSFHIYSWTTQCLIISDTLHIKIAHIQWLKIDNMVSSILTYSRTHQYKGFRRTKEKLTWMAQENAFLYTKQLQKRIMY